MNLAKLSLIGYGGDAFGTPLSLSRLDAALNAVGVGAGTSVLDLGCGAGQVALHMARRGARVTAVERHGIVAEAARARTADASPGDVDVLVGEAWALALPVVDVVLALGAGRLAGAGADAQATLAWLSQRAKPGGAVIWGETFWRRAPSPVLKMVGDAAGGLGTDADYRAAGEAAGLGLLWAEASGAAEWDAYVEGYAEALEAYRRGHPEDPDAEPMANRARAWRQLYEAEARDAMGFGLYVFRTPA